MLMGFWWNRVLLCKQDENRQSKINFKSIVIHYLNNNTHQLCLIFHSRQIPFQSTEILVSYTYTTILYNLPRKLHQINVLVFIFFNSLKSFPQSRLTYRVFD